MGRNTSLQERKGASEAAEVTCLHYKNLDGCLNNIHV
jgi:hypothetical protein